MQSAFLVISNRNSFRVLFDKIASAYFVWKIIKDIYILAFASPDINIFLKIKYTEEILPNSTRKLLWFEINRMLIAV